MKRSLVLLSLVSLFFLPVASAGVPANGIGRSETICDPSSQSYSNVFYLYGYSHVQSVALASTSCGGSMSTVIQTSPNMVNFTYLAFGSGGPASSFLLGVSSGNVTIGQPTANYLPMTEAGSPTMRYAYTAALSFPVGVVFNTGGVQTTVPSIHYLPTAAAFNACATSCVYLNAGNSTLAVKSSFSNGIIDVCFNSLCLGAATPSNVCIVAAIIGQNGSNSIILTSVLLLVLAAATVIMALVMLKDPKGSSLMPIVFVVLLIGTLVVIMDVLLGLSFAANNAIFSGFGCG